MSVRRKKVPLKEVPDVIHDRSAKRIFTKGRFLGKGGFARCYELIDNSTKKVFAGKIISKILLIEQHQKEKMYQEVTIHRSLCHPHIVKVEGCFEDDDNMYVLLELCTRRSLMELHKRRKIITEPEARYFIYQLATACGYLHGNKIVHRDLKLGNLFINEQMQIKIGDFGLATKLTFDGELKYTLCGTPNYIAPEMLGKKGHSYEVDIWAIGCVLFTLLVGKPPFETETVKDTYARILKNQYVIPPKITGNTRTLITQLLSSDPSKRPKVPEILHSPFITSGFMPSRLPTSCLTMTPKFNMSQTRKKQSPKVSNLISFPAECSKNKSNDEFKSNDDEIVIENYEIVDWKDSLRTLFDRLNLIYNSDAAKFNEADFVEVQDPASTPIYWISKWIDYSQKYGLGYQLCDDSVGAFFYDNTKLILDADGKQLQYIENNKTEQHYLYAQFPPYLDKKISLLRHFRAYMTDKLLKTGDNIPKQGNELARLPCVQFWYHLKNAIVFFLSNGVFQINFSQDHSKLIICLLMGAVTYIDANKYVTTFKFALLDKYGYPKELCLRLKYTRTILEHLLTNNLLDKPPATNPNF